MKRITVSLGLLACLLVFASAASADSMNFAISGSGFTTSGTFYGAPSAPGQWLVTSAAGNFNGVAITGVWPVSNNGNIFIFNNIYYWPAPVVDVAGIVLTLADGDLVNICYGVGGCASASNLYAALLWNASTGVIFMDASTTNFSAPTPEPQSLMLLGTGIVGLAGLLRRKLF